MSNEIETTAVVLAGGGERVIAWETGVLAGLADAGVDLRDAGLITGTSAGSFVAARLAAGIDQQAAADEIAARAPRPVEAPEGSPFEALAAVFESAGTVGEGRRRIGAFALAAETMSQDDSIARVARRLPDVDWPTALRLNGIDASAGERVTLDDRSGASLAAGVAASRAVPGALPPIEIGGRALIDGAVGSTTNADVVLEPDSELTRVVVIVALPTDSPQLATLWEDALRSELWQLDAAGLETYMVRASDTDIQAMGPSFMDGGQGPLAVRAGREAGRSVGPALREVLQRRSARPGSQRRLRRGAAVAALLGAAAFAAPAQGAVTLGTTDTGPAPADQPCFGMYFQEAVQGGGPNYVVPSRGVITRWSAEGAPDGTAVVALKVADGDQMVGETAAKSVAPSAEPTFNVRVPVRGGDRVGLAVIDGRNVCGRWTPNADNVVRHSFDEVSPPETFSLPRVLPRLQVNLKATVEPDADRDGFGDETQDDCPTDARTQDECTGDQPGTPPSQPEQPAPPTPQIPPQPKQPSLPPRPAIPPSRPAPPPVVAPRDTLAPGLTTRAAKRQRVARSRRLAVRVTPSEAAALTASARVNVRGVRLRAVRSTAGADQQVTLRLRTSKAGVRRLRAALDRRRRVLATVKVAARDGAGNATSRRVRIRVVG